jgi:hypothetical protein
MSRAEKRAEKAAEGRNRGFVGTLRGILLAAVGFVGLEMIEVLSDDSTVPNKAKPWVAFGLFALRSLEGTFDAWKKGREPGRNALGV